MVASPGPRTGNTILKKMVRCPAPSIFADSVIASGTEPEIKVLIRITRNGLISAGNQIAKVEPFKPSTLAYIRYQGIMPPPKMLVK